MRRLAFLAVLSAFALGCGSGEGADASAGADGSSDEGTDTSSAADAAGAPDARAGGADTSGSEGVGATDAGPVGDDTVPSGGHVGEADVVSQPVAACGASSECAAGEVCHGGVCEVERCVQTFASAPPLGSTFPLRGEDEVVTIGWNVFNGYTIHGWDVHGDDLTGHREVTMPRGDPIDVVGAQVGEARPEALLIIAESESSLTVVHPAYGGSIGLGLEPVAVAAGDVDGVGHEEALAIAEDGRWVVCDVPERRCQGGELPGFEVTDAAAGDVDGDGRDELVAIAQDATGEDVIVVVHVVQGPGEEAHDAFVPQVVVDRITAADLDDDGLAEVIGLEYGDALDVVRDGLMTWRVSPDGLDVLYAGSSGDFELVDIEAGDLDASGRARLLMITDDEEALIGTWSGAGWGFTGWLDAAPDNGDANYQVTLADLDGDAVLGRLSDGPLVQPAAVVPMAVLHYPPYDAEKAKGKATVAFGESSGGAEATTDGVGLSLKASVGVSAPMVDASVKTTISTKVSQKVKTQTGYKVLTQYKATAQPAIHGDRSAAVILGWGCFHGYTYEVDDPAGLATDLGAKNALMVSIPVGGGTTAWSSARYDAVVDLRGQGTRIEVAHTVGDPRTYRTSVVDGDGQPLAEEDLIFPLHELIVSDVADATWKLDFTESMTRETSLDVGIEVSADLKAPGFLFGVGGGVSTSTAYAVTAKSGIRFEGAVPPIPDDPATPSDEYATRRYAFTPYLYQREMISSDGLAVQVFVADYMVR